MKHRGGIAIVLAAFILFIAGLLAFTGSAQLAQERNVSGDLSTKFATADDVTADLRDPAYAIFSIEIATAADRAAASRFGRLIADYGSFVTLAAPEGTSIDLPGLQVHKLDTSIDLGGHRFDPIADLPEGTVSPGAGNASGGDGYYFVQFGTTANDELLDSVRAAGIEILQYVPNQAFFVYGSGESISKVAAHSRVRWVGRFLPELKLSTLLLDQLGAAKSGSRPAKGISPLTMVGKNIAVFDVAVFSRADLKQVSGQIADIYGGRVRNDILLPSNYFNVVRVELPLDQVAAVATIPDVIAIDFWSEPRIEDERAAHIVAGNYTNSTTISSPGYNPLSQFGADGTNVTVSMVDDGVSIPGNGGFYLTSANTVNGPLRGAAAGATGSHGHLNASIIAGSTPFGNLDPAGYNYGLGVANKSNIINIPLLVSGYTGVEADSYNDTVTTPGPNGVNGSISNNSWGNGTNSNVYDSYTAQFDGFVRDASAAPSIDPILLVFSAGNSGPSSLSLTRPKAAKNVIATGNSENLRTELSSSANNIDDLNSTSSRGPAADGRVKPDITAPGTVITGSRAGNCSSVSSCFETNHAWSSGTSHAAPQISGAAALFTQFWKSANGGANPSPALIKAAIINTAQDMNGVNTTAAVPNGNEGWGRVNMKYMLNTGVAMKRVNQSLTFTDPGNSTTYTGTVADGSKPVRVTLVWTDPPGAANANPALVNNLDLTVTIGGNTYKGNVFSGGVSTTGGSADTINNVENVWLPAGIAAGTAFTIQISATALNGDGVLGNADTTDQHFALVAYNFNEGVATPTPTATPTNTPTATPTNTPTATPTNTPTATPTNTPTATPTNTPTATPTNTPTATPTNTPTATPTPPPACGSFLYGSDTDGKLFFVNVNTAAGTFVGQLPVNASTEIEYDPVSNRAFVQAGGFGYTGYEFNLSNGAAIGPEINTAHTFNGLEWVGSTLYGTSIDIPNGPSSLRIFDPWTGNSTLIGLTGIGPVSGLAYNSGTATMYGVSAGAGPNNLLTINLTTGAATIIGPLGFVPGSLEFGNDGLLYAGGGQADAGNLYRVNPATGAGTLIGSTGFYDVSGLANVCRQGTGQGFEGDVAPRPNGDGVVIATDVTQLRRFATGLDTPGVGSNEAQRADIAPRATFGDGAINSGDVVQGRRYATGLDPLTPAGGPAARPQTEGLMAIIDDVYAYFFGREMRIGNSISDSPKTVTVPVEIRPYGDEMAASFTMEYDAAKLSNPQITLGDAAPEGAVLTVNTNETGRIGILVDSTNAFTASAMPRRFVVVTFEVVDASGGTTPITLTSSLAAKGTSDSEGNTLTVRYIDGSVSLPRAADTGR